MPSTRTKTFRRRGQAVRQRSAKPPSRVRVSAPPLFSRSRAWPRVLASACLLLALGAPGSSAAAQDPQGVWPRDWSTDLPAVDLSGTWVLNAEHSDPLPTDWQDLKVEYLITQLSAHIQLVFTVGVEQNGQTYRWDNKIEQFERGGRLVEETARWAEGGRVFEVRGRHWNPQEPEVKDEYRFTYTVRGEELTFVQESRGGKTTWRFDLDRTREDRPRPEVSPDREVSDGVDGLR